MNPICLALDFDDRATFERVVDETATLVGMFKVGLTSFCALGPPAIDRAASARPVFVDLKLHDIPVQVAGAVRALAARDAAFLSVHASGGYEMVRAAVDAAGDSARVLAVTVLTSLDRVELARIGIADSIDAAVARLAESALSAGAHGIVCSPHEVADMRRRFGDGPTLVVPGVRPSHAAADDQRRTATPKEALTAGADLIVVGRPVTAAPDRRGALEAILAEVA